MSVTVAALAVKEPAYALCGAVRHGWRAVSCLPECASSTSTPDRKQRLGPDDLFFFEQLIVKYFLIFPFLYLVSGGVSAEIFRYVDPITGNVILSNVPLHGKASRTAAAPRFNVAPMRVSHRPAANALTSISPADFPRVTMAQQRDRDDERRQILIDELKAEQEAFDKARATNASDAEINRLRDNIAALERELHRAQ